MRLSVRYDCECELGGKFFILHSFGSFMLYIPHGSFGRYRALTLSQTGFFSKKCQICCFEKRTENYVAKLEPILCLSIG